MPTTDQSSCQSWWHTYKQPQTTHVSDSTLAVRLNAGTAAIFGRPFVKRFALCYRSVVCLSVCLSVLSCLSVCDVRALWPNGWTDQDETWHAGRPRPWPHCISWGSRSPSPKGHSPQFSANICCGQMAAWIKMSLGMELGLGQGDFVLDGDHAPPPQKGGGGGAPKFSAHVYCFLPYPCEEAICLHPDLCFSNYRIRVKYSAESRDVTDVICAKNRLQYVHLPLP